MNTLCKGIIDRYNPEMCYYGRGLKTDIWRARYDSRKGYYFGRVVHFVDVPFGSTYETALKRLNKFLVSLCREETGYI